MFQEAVIVVDRVGRIQLATRAASALFGADDPDDLLGRRVDDLASLGDRDALLAAIEQACAGKASVVEHAMGLPGTDARVIALSLRGIASESVGTLCLAELRAGEPGRSDAQAPPSTGVGVSGELDRMARVHKALCDTYEAEISDLQTERAELLTQVTRLEDERQTLTGRTQDFDRLQRAQHHTRSVVSDVRDELHAAITRARTSRSSR